MRHHRFMSIVCALIAIVTLGASLLFLGSGESLNAKTACAIAVLSGLLSLGYRELGKPQAWSTYRHPVR